MINTHTEYLMSFLRWILMFSILTWFLWDLSSEVGNHNKLVNQIANDLGLNVISLNLTLV